MIPQKGTFDHMSREDLQALLEVNLQDLETVAAWIAEIQMKLHPNWGPLMAFGTCIYAISELATHIAEEEVKS